MRGTGLDAYFPAERRVTISDLASQADAKPGPAPYLLAAKRLGLPPGACRGAPPHSRSVLRQQCSDLLYEVHRSHRWKVHRNPTSRNGAPWHPLS